MKRVAATVLVLLGAGLLAACAAPPPAALTTARANFESARANPQITRYAAAELDQAQQRLAAADQAVRDDGVDEAEHRAILADKQVQIAAARADQREAREQIGQFAEQLAGQLATRQTDRGTVVTLRDVLFDTGQATLNPGGNQQITRLAAWLAGQPDARVRIEGHTDSTGSAELNRELSQRRADAVRNALIGAGVEPDRLTAVGLGEDLPVATNATAAGRQQNRRVEVIVENAGTAT